MVNFGKKEINSLTFSTLKHVHITEMFLLLDCRDLYQMNMQSSI